MGQKEKVTPGEVLGKAADYKPGKGTYVAADAAGVKLVYASLTGFRTLSPPSVDSLDQRSIVEVTGHKAHGAVPEPGCTVLARVKKVMAKMASADIMCVGNKSVREKFTGMIRQQDVRATEIDKVDMHASFRAGDVVRAVVLSLGDARAYYLSTAKNELGVVSAESMAVRHYLCREISWYFNFIFNEALFAGDLFDRDCKIRFATIGLVLLARRVESKGEFITDVQF